MKNLARIGMMFALPLSCLFTTSCNERGKTFTVNITRPKSGSISETFRNIDLNMSDKQMRENGFLYGDIVTVTVKDKNGNNAISYDLPYVTNFNEAGTFGPCLCNYGGKSNTTNVSPGLRIEGIKENDYFGGGTAEIKMKKVDGFYETRSLAKTTTKLTYEECGFENTKYANCRDVVNVGTISDYVFPGTLYRSSTPICGDNNKDRYEYADNYCSLKDIEYDISLSLSKEDLENDVMKRSSGVGTYMKSLYTRDRICTINLGNDWFSKVDDGVGYGGGTEIKKVFDYIEDKITQSNATHSFNIHCNEGKDRTGFIVMLIEALCGCPLKDLVADYMLTFCNYYNITEVNNKKKYDVMANLTCYRNLYAFMIKADSSKERYNKLNNIDMLNFDSKKAVENLIKENVNEYCSESDYLFNCATNYLKNIGMTDNQITNIRSGFTSMPNKQ